MIAANVANANMYSTYFGRPSDPLGEGDVTFQFRQMNVLMSRSRFSCFTSAVSSVLCSGSPKPINRGEHRSTPRRVGAEPERDVIARVGKSEPAERFSGSQQKVPDKTGCVLCKSSGRFLCCRIYKSVPSMEDNQWLFSWKGTKNKNVIYFTFVINLLPYRRLLNSSLC